MFTFFLIGDYDRVEELKALINYIRAAGCGLGKRGNLVKFKVEFRNKFEEVT
jgi:hypothetical protein